MGLQCFGWCSVLFGMEIASTQQNWGNNRRNIKLREYGPVAVGDEVKLRLRDFLGASKCLLSPPSTLTLRVPLLLVPCCLCLYYRTVLLARRTRVSFSCSRNYFFLQKRRRPKVESSLDLLRNPAVRGGLGFRGHLYPQF